MQIDAYDTSINSVATVDEDDDGKPSEKLKVISTSCGTKDSNCKLGISTLYNGGNYV